MDISRHATATAVLVGALTSAPAAQVFVDASEALGAGYVHAEGPHTLMMAGGTAFLDVDGDGDDDLFVTSGDGQHRLFRWDGASFADVSAAWGVASPGPRDTMGVAVGDYDDDGDPDLFLTNNGPNQMLRNDGGIFTDVSDALGIASDRMSTTASFADFDRDGDLDLYVGNYIEVLAFPFHVGAPNELWVNEGTPAEPSFVERAAELGVDVVGVFPPPPPGFEPGKTGEPTAGCTLSTCTLDVDDDGDADLLVGNDFGLFVLRNRIFRNDTPPGGPLAFTDVSAETGFDAFPQYNMGINPSDVDGDGDWDLYLSDLGPNLLLRNDAGAFVDVTAEAGPVEGHDDETGNLLRTSWTSVFADFDNDGWEDLYVVNGHIPAASFILNEVRSPNGLWRNAADGSVAFEEVDDLLAGSADEAVGRGASASDVDGDGRMDVHLLNNGMRLYQFPGDRSRLFMNTGALGDGHWLQLRLRGVFCNVEAVGARVDAFDAGHRMRRQVLADGVYASARSRLLHFGLADRDVVERIEVRWPSGTYQELHDVPADQRAVVLEPRLVFAGAPEVSLPGSLAKVSVGVDNLDAVTRRARVEVVLSRDGVVLAQAAAERPAPAGGRVRVEVAVPLGDVAAQGELEVDVSVRDTVHPAVDMREVVLSRGR